MRTTVTLDPDTDQLIKKLMEERSMGFKQAINFAVRVGLAGATSGAAQPTPTFHMGFRPGVSLDKALSLAASLEDEEIARKLSTRK